jgi:hypothetical protein
MKHIIVINIQENKCKHKGHKQKYVLAIYMNGINYKLYKTILSAFPENTLSINPLQAVIARLLTVKINLLFQLSYSTDA